MQHFFIFKDMKKKHKFPVIFLLLCLSGFLSAQVSTMVSEKVNSAKNDYQNGNYRASAKAFTDLLKNDYKNTYYLNYAGLAYFGLKDYENAKKYFALATLYSDKDALTWANLAAAYNNLGEHQKAYDASVKALKFGKTSQTIFNAASNANNINRLDEALAILDNAGTDFEPDMECLYARIYYKKNNFKKSIEHFKVFFENLNDDVTVFNILNEKRIYFFALISDMDNNVVPKFDNKNLTEQLFYNLVNTSNYDLSEEFITDTTSVMQYVTQQNSAYLDYFLKYENLIKNPVTKEQFHSLLYN